MQPTWVRALSFALALCATCVLSLAAIAPTAGAACPNEALREDQGSTSLPGCRALEMVSPPKKFSQPAYLPSFSQDGQRLQMLVLTALAETPGYQYYGGDRYIAGRSAAAWAISPTSPLDPPISAGGRTWGGALAFTPELDRWAQLAATQAQFQVGIAQLFSGGLDGSFDPLSPLLVPIDDSGTTGKPIQDLELTATSADLSAAILRVAFGSTGYLVGDPHNSSTLSEPGGSRNSYVAFLDEAGDPALELLARDKDDTVYGGRCGAHLGGAGSSFDQGILNPQLTQGAISPDGERIFFSTRPAQPWEEGEAKGPTCNVGNGLRVLKRVAAPDGPTISEIAPGPEAPGDDLFQAASADGTKVYLLSPRKLTASDTDASSGPCSATLGASKGCDLYLYDESRPPGERLVLASDGPEEAGVLNSTTAISGDGSRAYFVAQGILTSDQNPEGASAQAGAPNLYLYDAETEGLSFLATVSPEDSTGLWNSTKGQGFGEAFASPVHGAGPEDGGDGHVLGFASRASLTADDLDGGFRDVFRYDAQEGTLERISKAAEGGSDNGPFDAFVNPAWFKEQSFNFGEATRWVSEDGKLLGFATKEALIPADEDGAMNPYFWDGGVLGAAFAPLFDEGGETRPPAVAPAGGQVAFSTPAALLGFDKDVVEDVYVGRPDGGFAEPEPLPPCQPLQAGACQGPPSSKPAAVPLPANGTNVKPKLKKPTKCKKGFVKRKGKGKCVKKKQGKHKGGRA